MCLNKLNDNVLDQHMQVFFGSENFRAEDWFKQLKMSPSTFITSSCMVIQRISVINYHKIMSSVKINKVKDT